MFTQRFITYGLRTDSYTKSVKVLYSKFLQQEVKEVEIPMPWGKVAGKLWGSQDKQPILAVHGWQDNAASFNNIAPLIMKHTPVLAIDLPGHGLSSWIPPGFMYNELIYILLIKRIKNHFGWEKVKMLGHSLNAMMVHWYGACFPKDMQYIIALDIFKFASMDPIAHITMFANTLEAFLKVEQNTVQPSYKTQSEIIKKAKKPGFPVLDDSSYKILMTRGTTRKEDGTYVINRDPRLRVTPMNMFSQDQLEAYANLFKCPYLIIQGDKNFYPEEKENFYRALEILHAANDKVQFETISATHHPHLTHVESTTAIIIPFLEKYD